MQQSNKQKTALLQHFTCNETLLSAPYKYQGKTQKGSVTSCVREFLRRYCLRANKYGKKEMENKKEKSRTEVKDRNAEPKIVTICFKLNHLVGWSSPLSVLLHVAFKPPAL